MRGAPAVLDSGDRHAPPASTEVADASIQTATHHVLAVVNAAQFAELAAGGFFDPAAEADVDKVLDDVLKGLRAMEGLEEGRLTRVGHSSKGFASADFARLVEEAVRAKLKAEARGLIRASPASGVIRDEFDRFALNAAAAVDTALGLVYSALGQRWEAVARPGLVENYAHVLEKSPRGLKVRKRDVVHYLRYEVGDVVYGAAKAKGVVVLVFLGGKESIRVEVLAKSVAGLPIRFEEKEWGGEKRLRLATANMHKPKNYVAQIEFKFVEKPKVEARGGAAGVDGLRGLLVTDASGEWIRTPDPLLVKLFVHHFEKVKVEVVGVTLTEAGPTLQFKAVALDDKPFEELFGDIAERYGRGVGYIRDKAKDMWLETAHKLSADIKRVADEAAEMGKREKDVEAGRRTLVEGLRRLFEEREREALNAGHLDDALAIAVAGRLTVGIVNSRWEWFSLLAGDGVVDIAHKTLGFSAKYAEVAEVVLCLLAVWAGAYGAEIRVEEEKGMAMYTSSEDVAKVLKALLRGDVLRRAESLARSWSGLAGSNAPKVVSLLALAQLLGVVEGKWAVELWLAHKAVTTPTPPEVAQVLERLIARVESVDKVKWEERSVNLYFKVGGVEDVERAVTLRLYTNFSYFYLYCDSCVGETSAKRVLETVAEWLRPAVTKDRLEWPRWHGDALVLPAEVGWPMFLRLWTRKCMSFPIVEGRLHVEVLEARADGTAKFRLWYYKWHETRPHQPYVDVEIRSYPHRGGVRFVGRTYANEAMGIPKDHLAEIADLLKRERVRGVSLWGNGKALEFTGAFRDSVLRRIGIEPELPPGEPPAVEHLGGLRFRVGDREVEFGRGYVKGGYEFYAELTFPSEREAENFAKSLKAIAVDARIVSSEKAGYTVRLDSDSFFGLLAATNATPPGLTPLYRSEEDDFRVYASMEGGRMRFYFAVKHEGAWRAVEGLYNENLKGIILTRTERDVLEAIKDAVARALKELGREQQGRPAKVEEPKEDRGEGDNAKVYYLYLYGPQLVPFLEHAVDSIEAKPAEVRLEGRRIVISAGGVEAKVEFKLLKGKEAEYLMAKDVEQTLALYKSLKEVGVRVEITPGGVKINSEAMWALVTIAVERGTPSVLPAEVMPGVELLKAYNASGMKLYAFRVSEEGAHYYFVVKAGEEWKAAGGKYSKRQVQIAGEATPKIAEAINAIYREMGVDRRVEVKYDKHRDRHYIILTNVDLELLDLTRRVT